MSAVEKTILHTGYPFVDSSAASDSVPTLVTLSRAWMEEAAELEQRCYPSPWSRELVRGEFLKIISFRVGLVVDDRLVAYAFSYLIPEDMHLLNLAVAPEYRSRGYGTYLLCNLIMRGVLRGVEFVSLEVRASNLKAQQLYGSLGFTQSSVRKAYYRDNGEDAFLYDREVSGDDLPFFERSAFRAL